MDSDKEISLNRKRKPSAEGSQIIFNDKDLTSLLLRSDVSLEEREKNLLLEAYDEYGRSFFYDLSENNRIVPFAAQIFISLACDVSFWSEKLQFYIKRNESIKDLLEDIFSKADHYSCKSVTLTENFAVVLTTGICIGCFSSGDIDLSADLMEKDKITKWLNSFGFFSKEQPDQIGEYSGQSMQFHNPDIIEEGFWINVIWKPVTRAFLIQDKYDKRLSSDRLLAKTKEGSEIRILDDTSLLYFCALHISAGHYYTLSPGLRLYVDLDRLVRNNNIDWSSIDKWEDEDNAGIRISVALYLSHLLLKTPIPKSVIQRALVNNRSKGLINYLYNSETNQIQGKSSKIRRLYVELASDNKFIVTNFFSRIFQLIRSKI